MLAAMTFIRSLLHLFAALASAIIGWLSRRRRDRYAASRVVAAAPAALWDILVRPEIMFVGNGATVLQVPIEGRPGAYLGISQVNGRDMVRIAFEITERRAPSLLRCRYLDDPVPVGMPIGADDCYDMILEPTDDGGTRLTLIREVTHRSFATRFVGPLQLQTAADLMKTQGEHESGRAPVRAGSAPLRHLLLSIAAVASFVWLFGWQDAWILMAVIAVHEAGHALAMLRYGLGVRMISFVPFFGGVAASRRPPATQWQSIVILLMGVGFSLPFATGLYAYAHTHVEPLAAKAAAMFAIVNAVNLLPVPALDGGQVASLLLGRVHRGLALAVMWAMLAALAALAVTIGDPLLWLVVAFSALVTIISSSIDTRHTLAPMSRATAVVAWLVFVGLVVAYGILASAAVMLDLRLSRLVVG